MDKRISPAAHCGLGNASFPQLRWQPSDRPAMSNGPDVCQLVEHTRAGAIVGTGGQHLPQFTQRPARTCAVEPMPAPGVLDAHPLSDLSEQTSTCGLAPQADGSTTDDACLLEGRVAALVRLLDNDGHPITSREEAAEHELLAEWERLGKLCVCREVLPAMPRWFPRSMAAELMAAAEAKSPGSSTLHPLCVEFADGYLTVLEREELSFLPL